MFFCFDRFRLRQNGQQIFFFNDCVLNVLRYVQPNRTAPAGHCNIVGFLNFAFDLQRIRHQFGVFCHRFNGIDDIKFLYSSGSQRNAGVWYGRIIPALSRNDQHGNTVNIGPHHARQRIRSARSRCDAYQRGFVSRVTRIAFGSHGAGLFVMIKNRFNAF